MLFKDIVGQEHIKKRLVKTVKENHISHAQLFIGPEGCGNLALAIAYAQYILCENPGEYDACGTCASCQKIQKLVHPDLHFIFPVVNIKQKTSVSNDYIEQWREMVKKTYYFSVNQWYYHIGVENKQGMIHKEEGREIIRKLSLKTFEGEYKIMIIWKPETLNRSAANTILKILEEPPEKTLFIMVGENTESMLPTILSRTQILKIPKIDNDNLHKALIERYPDRDDLQQVVHLANGNYIKAVELMEADEDATYNLQQFITLMRLCFKMEIDKIIEWVDKIASIGREKQKLFLTFAIRMVRENYIMHFNKPELLFLSNEEKDFSDKFHPFVKGSNVIKIYEEFNNAFYHIGMNANAKILFLDLALRISSLLRMKRNKK